MLKYFLLLLLSALVISCSKDDKSVQNQQTSDKKQNEETENLADTNLTPEEKFSSAILVDFLNDSEDEDLASFLETELYKMGANYTGTAVVEITPSSWLAVMEKDGAAKNFLIQKYIDFKTNDYYFSMKETTLTLTDIISKSRNRTSAGE
jgi:Flp pilus assembly protein TadD